jgi:hypothetical protein
MHTYQYLLGLLAPAANSQLLGHYRLPLVDLSKAMAGLAGERPGWHRRPSSDRSRKDQSKKQKSKGLTFPAVLVPVCPLLLLLHPVWSSDNNRLPNTASGDKDISRLQDAL